MSDISPEAAELAHKVTPTGWHGTVIDEALRKAKADAWDEGLGVGFKEGLGGATGVQQQWASNPYRLSE